MDSCFGIVRPHQHGTGYGMWLDQVVNREEHPSVTDLVESLSSPGFRKKRHWVQLPTGSAYFRVSFFFFITLFDTKMASCQK